MNKIYSSALVLFLFIYGVEASAQQSVWTIHSSVCEAINPAQSQKMEWRETGLVNRDPSRPLWVMCPVMSKFFDSNSQDSSIVITIANDNPQSIEVNCILRFFEMNKETLTSSSLTQIVSPGDQVAFFWALRNMSIGLPNIACKLPPNGVIVGISADYTDF
jgi:hypothetical protein